MITIQSTDSVRLDKRTHLPFKFSRTCPKCGNLIEIDLSDGSSYLSYPTLPGKNKVNLYCGADLGETDCDFEEKVEVVFEITARLHEAE